MHDPSNPLLSSTSLVPVTARSEFSRAWTVVLAAACGVGVGITGLPFYTFGVFIAPISAEFGWTRSEITFGSLCLSLGTFIMAPFIGSLVDKLGARRVGLASLLGLGLGYVGLSLAISTPLSWYLSWFVVALLGSGTAAMVWTKVVAQWFEIARGFALAMTLIGTGIAAATGPIFVNLLISHFGWRAGFLGISAVTLFGVIPIVIVLFRSPTKTVDQNIAAPPGGIVTRENSGIALRDAIRHRDFWRLGVGFFIVSLGIASSIVHLIPLMTDRGIIRESAAGIAGMLGLAVIAGRLACGYLVDRFNPPMIAGACLLVPALGSVVLIFAGADTQWLILGALMIGIAAGAEVDLVAFLTGRQFGLSAFGTILGWQLAMFGAGAALGPFMLGLMRDYFGNYETGLWVYAGCYVCGSILIMGLGPAVRSDHPKIA